jgi:hypothetical protein
MNINVQINDWSQENKKIKTFSKCGTTNTIVIDHLENFFSHKLRISFAYSNYILIQNIDVGK